MSNDSKRLYEFENFRLDAENPGLWRDGELVAVPPKVLETLILLVQRSGEIVSRDELLEKIWKQSFVEEGNINYTISQLRKTLGEKNLVQTVPKRGYRFVGKIESVSFNPKSKENVDVFTAEMKTAEPAVIKPSPTIPQNNFRWIALAVVLAGILGLTVLAFRSKSEAFVKNPSNQTTEDARMETVEALNAYTRGRMILDDRDMQKREERSIEEFQRAITLDPTLAVAHAGLAEALAVSAVSSTGEKSQNLYAKAKIAVEKALRLDENLAEAYVTRGMIRRNGDWDWRGAEEDFRRATELKPNDARAHSRYAHLLSPLGRHDEALAEMNKALLLDSLSEAVLIGQFSVLESRGEYDEAIRRAEEFLRVNPDNALAKRGYATFLYHKGEYARVIEIGEKFLEKNPNRKPFAWLSLLAGSYHRTNQPEKADALLKELETQAQTDTKSLYSLAMNYAETDRPAEAVAALEKCFAAREERMVWVNVEPRFAALREDAGFQGLVRKMNF